YVTRYETKGHAEVESRILGNENVRFGRGVTGILDQVPRSLPHQNLAAALVEVFTTHQQALAAVNATACQQSIPLPDGTVAVPVPPPPTPRREQERADQRAAARQATYETVRTLRHQGWTVPAIAAQVGCSRRTVERYLCLPARAGRETPPPLWTQYPHPL